jgi:hypothetical protein
LLNFRKHAHDDGRHIDSTWVDPFSSAPTFDGWRTPLRSQFSSADFGTVPARTWLLSVGWRRHGLVALDETPNGGWRDDGRAWSTSSCATE